MDKNKKYIDREEEDDDFLEDSSYDDTDYDDTDYDDTDYDDTDDDEADYNVSDIDVDELGTEYEDLEDRWYEIETDYRDRYPDLTDDDVTVEPGRFDMTMDRIGRRTNRSPNQVRQDIENWR